MKCINNELVQKYIDGETNSQETANIEKHLTECTKCIKKVEEQKAFSDVIKNDTGLWYSQPVIIPEFITPVSNKRKISVKIRHIVYAASAACAILLFVFLFYEQNNLKEQSHPNSVHLIYTFSGDFDANKTISQQEMTIMVINSDKKTIEYF